MQVDGIKPLWTLIAIGIVALVFFAGRWSMNGDINRRDRDLSYYRETYQQRSGASHGFGSYHLVSLDAGRTWHAHDRNTGSITPADPALLDHLDGVERLLAHVKAHGPIGQRPITDADIRALTGAGFEVKHHGD